jgi:hypothetical protein
MHFLGQAFGRIVLKPLIEETRSSITVAIYGIPGMGKSVFVAGTALAFGILGNFSRLKSKDGCVLQHMDFAPETYQSLSEESANPVDQSAHTNMLRSLKGSSCDIDMMEHPSIVDAISATYVICISDKHGGDSIYYKCLSQWAMAARDTTQTKSVLQQINDLPRLAAQLKDTERLVSISQLDPEISRPVLDQFSARASLDFGLAL